MSYYVYVKKDIDIEQIGYHAPKDLNHGFQTLEEAETYAKNYIQEWYDDLHDLQVHKKLTTDFRIFRIWIVDGEAIAKDYMQEYVPNNWKPGQDFKWKRITNYVKDIYPSNCIDNKKAIVKKIKVEFEEDKTIADILKQRKEKQAQRSEELQQEYENSLETVACAGGWHNNNIDLPEIKDEYAFVFPDKGSHLNVKKNEHSKPFRKGHGFVLAHIKFQKDHKDRWFVNTYTTDFYEGFKDMNSLTLVASINGWDPIVFPEFLYRWNEYGGTILSKTGVKNALEWLKAYNLKRAA